MRKIGLVVGLNYKGSPYELHGCEKDANAIAQRARDRGVFCSVLKGKIGSAYLLESLRTIGEVAKPGDITYFYYSGHGTQWYDPAGDGEQDRQTEGICLWNGDEIEVLPDDDLRAALLAIPGQVVVIFDSCFSGGMQRESAKPGRSRRSIEFSDFRIVRPAEKNVAAAQKIYWLFACGEQEVSWETPAGGNFTVSLCYWMDRLQRRSIAALMAGAVKDCAPDQHPEFRKDGKTNAQKVIF